jgi:hypothetical protein
VMGSTLLDVQSSTSASAKAKARSNLPASWMLACGVADGFPHHRAVGKLADAPTYAQSTIVRALVIAVRNQET